MAKRTIGKPRFYADIPSYLKSLGYYTGANSNGLLEGQENAENVWNMNPVQTNNFKINPNPESFAFRFYTAGDPAEVVPITEGNKQLSKLLSEVNYAGILNHNLGTLESSDSGVADSVFLFYSGKYLNDSGEESTDSGRAEILTEIVNFNKIEETEGIPEYNGYSLWEIGDMRNSNSPYAFSGIQMIVRKQEDKDFTANIGALTFGRFFEPSHSPDLSVKLIKSYEGANIQTTVGGSTITNFNHLGQPHWGDLPAWTLEKQEGHDYKIGAERGRRTWQVTLSYMSDSDVFSTSTNENKFFTWNNPEETTDGSLEYTFDSSMASFFNLTHNGNLRFVFCPDKDADNKEFALCVIDQDSLTYTQVAHRTWSVSMNIMEVW